jgi:hypothetical protein
MTEEQDNFDHLYALAQEIVRRLIVDVEGRYELGAGWAREPVLNRPGIRREWEDMVLECLGRDSNEP